MRTYSPDSPEDAARIVALMVLADGHVCRSEMQALDALHATAQLQLAPGALQAVLRGLAEDLQTHAYPQWGSTCQMDNQTLCALLDRMFFMKSAPYAFKPAAAVVSCRRGGASASFDRLNKYFTIARMPLVSSQYWNSVHGNNAEEVVQDKEGMQIMRTLGNNMAWLIKCIAAGKAAGINPPTIEAWEATNFIR